MEQLQRKMQEGYPVTRTPWIPSIMERAVKFETVEYEEGQPMLKLAFAAEGADLVQEDSLKMIQEKLECFYRAAPSLQKAVLATWPRNTIAVSFAMMSFQVGESCNEVTLSSEFEAPNDAYFTYQKLSENLQATYYNEHGIEYLAGLCYFPAVHGMPDITMSDEAAISFAHLKSDYYPLSNREELPMFQTHKAYGRYCNTAKKRVVVSFDNFNRAHKHWTYDFVKDRNVFKYCQECQEDSVNYKFEEPKSSLQKLECTETKPENHKDKFPALRFLESAGIGLTELNRMSSLKMDTKIPMVHATTMKQLPEPQQPELRDILQFVMVNPKWKINKDFVSELPAPFGAFPSDKIRLYDKESGAVSGFSPDVSHLARFLDSIQYINVHSSSALIARLVLGTEYNHRIGDDVDSGNVMDLKALKVSDESTSQEDVEAEVSDQEPTSSDEKSDVVDVGETFSGEDFELIN